MSHVPAVPDVSPGEGAPRVIVAGVSARAAAESAARAGFEVCAIDAFGDRDHPAGIRAIALPRDLGMPFSPRAAARAARSLAADAVVYLAGFENASSAVATLAAGRALWGNRPEVLRRVRDPQMVARALRDRGLTAPMAYVGDPPLQSDGAGDARAEPGAWLLKPLASGGGLAVRRWTGTGIRDRLPRGRYLQQFVPGTPASIVFVAAGGRVVPLAVSRQLVGDDAFGARGYRYCGSLLCPSGDPLLPGGAPLEAAAVALAGAIAEAFDLVGVNGIDFIARGDVPWAIEVNPRWCASMELVERAGGPSVFALHAAACRSGLLPRAEAMPSRRGAIGKAVVFARHDVRVGDTTAWLADPDVRDVPHAGERIAAGRPVCTVFASGADGAACHAALAARARQIYRELG